MCDATHHNLFGLVLTDVDEAAGINITWNNNLECTHIYMYNMYHKQGGKNCQWLFYYLLYASDIHDPCYII